MITKLELAHYFHKLGVSVIPIHYRTKTPAVQWSEFGYRPGNPCRNPTEQELAKWFATELVNIGICTGWHGLTVLDFDDASEYGKWMSASGEVQRLAYRVSTSRGIHVYIRLPHAERARKVGRIDIKGIGGYVLGAGSIHPSGLQYRALREPIVIPFVETLSDVLPAAALLSDHTEPAGVKLPSAPALPQDAWGAAMSPRAVAGAIDRIKKRYRIEDFFRNKTKTGKHWYVTECPLHDDKTPSLWLDTERQICGCFAGCASKPMDVINLVARIKGVSNFEAIHFLSEVA